MKKLAIATVITLAFFSCKEEVKDYVTFSGTITNQNSDSLVVMNRMGTIKKFNVDEKGNFSDTLKIKTGTYFLFDGKEFTRVFLKNGFDLNLTANTEKFDETIKYTGRGQDENNYLSKKGMLQEEKMSDPSFLDLEEDAFNARVKDITFSFSSLLKNTKNLDSTLVAEENKGIEAIEEQLLASYAEKQAIKSINGKESPKFVDYENHAGGTTSLNDLKGKYVYIDLWATWCGPCKKEIPYLKEVEKAYHDKNIEFVSISIDSPKDREKWMAMVTEKELTGLQLYAKGDQQFMKDYRVSGIPRFILIDPEGKVVSADAPRPSDPGLRDLLDSHI